MRTIDPEIQARLINEWLPRLRELRHERRPLQLLMIIVLLTPLVVVLTIVVHTILSGASLDWTKGSVSVMLLGISCLCFVYLGKLQECNDRLLIIEFAVLEGDQERLHRAVSMLTCFGRLRRILEDAKRVIRQG